MRVSFLIRYGLVFAASLSIAACGIGGGGSASITTQPVNQSVTAGQTATFSVTVTTTGTPVPLSYQWYKNGMAIAAATSSSYTTNATTLADNGSTFYVVIASVGMNTLTSNTTTLTVLPPWAGTRQSGVAGATTTASGIATDAWGNVYVTGCTDGGLDGNTLTGTLDFFLTRYDSSGQKLYTRQLGAIGQRTCAYGVAVDASGNLYITGWTSGGLDGNTVTGTVDFFLTKYDSGGQKLYTRQSGVAGSATPASGVAVDSSGNVYVAGQTSGGLDGNARAGYYDLFLTRYDSNGQKQYTRQLGASGADVFAQGVATDSNGNIYVTGHTTGGLDGNTLTGSQDAFLTRYDSNGQRQYTRQWGTSGAHVFAQGLAVDAGGNVHVAGETNGGLDGNTRTGYQDFFLTRYDSSGQKQYTRQLGAVHFFTSAYGVATDASSNVYVTGATGGGLDGNTLSGPGSTDFFVTRYDSSGQKQYTRQLGVSADPFINALSTMGKAVVSDARGNVFVTGDTTGGLDGNTLTGTTDFFLTKYDSSGVKQ